MTDHIFAVLGDAMVSAAQRNPEKYPEVIVRVAGHSAHFVDTSSKTRTISS